MERKTVFIIGAALLFVAGIAAVAVAQKTDSQNAANYHECTPEMMMTSNNASEMARNCTHEMMDSGNCDAAGAAMAGCSSMTADTDSVTGDHMADPDHCNDAGSGMGSMMGTGKQTMA